MLMTPGPTEIPQEVRNAMGREIQNPDLDEDFFDFYHSLEDKLKEVFNTNNHVLILGGEGILGLETSIASIIDKGDEVLCISNGVYGDGFADFVKMYGGDPSMCREPYDETLDIGKVKRSLESHDFKAATMVHCETPTGTLNDINEILEILKDNEVLTIVDAVSSLGGTKVPVDKIDLCIGGSQKCFSSPPGLTMLSVSEDAWQAVEEKEQRTFYTSLAPWREDLLENEVFPYTHLTSNLYALDRSIDLLLREGLGKVFERHERAAEQCRESGKNMGLDLFPKSEAHCSPTVTAFSVSPSASRIRSELKEKHGILIATGLGELEDRIVRIGHMGYNADLEKVEKTMSALEDVI